MKASQFLQKMATLDRQSLLKIKGIGEVLADNYIEFFSSDRYKTLMSEFRLLEEKGKGLEVKLSKVTTNLSDSNLPLNGQTIVITGTFDISRHKIKEILEQLGAKVGTSITSSTTTLIAGENAGSKLNQAQQKGIKIINDYKILTQEYSV